MKLIDKSQFKTNIGQKIYEAFGLKMNWAAAATNDEPPIEHKFLSGMLAVEALFCEVMTDGKLSDMQKSIMDELSKDSENTLEAEKAINHWPFHATQILAELRYPELLEDQDKAVKVAEEIDYYLNHFFEIDYPVGHCEPHGKPSLKHQHLVERVYTFMFPLVEQAIGDVDASRDPNLKYDVQYGYIPKQFS
jgi:hypothetical protein